MPLRRTRRTEDMNKEIQDIASEALEEWWKDWVVSYKTNIKKQMTDSMNANMFNVLGLERGWRGTEWKVSQTNGNHNVISDHLKAHAKERVDEFLKLILDFIPKEPPEEMRESAIKLYNEEFRAALRSKVSDAARQAAANFAEELVDALNFDELPPPEEVAIYDAEERLDTNGTETKGQH